MPPGRPCDRGRRAERGLPGRRVHLAWHCVLFATLLLGGCQTAQVREERLARFFDEIMFGGAFDAHLVQDKKLKRWDGPICAEVTGPKAAQFRERVAALLSRIARLTGTDVRLADSASCEANVVVKLTRESAFLVNREYANCYVTLGERDGTIIRAAVYIGVERMERFDKCLAHEFLHVFGFRYHSGIVRSILSPGHAVDGLSVWDELVLRAAYDQRLSPGMSRDEAMPIVRRILSAGASQ